MKKKLAAYEALCRWIGESPSHVAPAWLLDNPVATGPIIGPRTLAQLNDSVCALDIDLSPDVLREIDELFPGPGGEAPMAYAW
jgi:aryl-alcohol dehydrogenase-like predicted oxidoreductase